jgi:hypothetical protein
MSRKLAYAFVAALGYFLGVLLYLAVVAIVPLVPHLAARIASLNIPRQVLDAMVSGFAGAVIAVAAAYYWASKTEEII